MKHIHSFESFVNERQEEREKEVLESQEEYVGILFVDKKGGTVKVEDSSEKETILLGDYLPVIKVLPGFNYLVKSQESGKTLRVSGKMGVVKLKSDPGGLKKNWQEKLDLISK